MATFSYPRAKILLIAAVTSASLVNALPVSPVSTTEGSSPLPVVSTNFVTAICEPSLTYKIVVSPVGVVGAGGKYPSSLLAGFLGVNGCPSGPTGVVPGTYGIVVVGVPGFVGSDG